MKPKWAWLLPLLAGFPPCWPAQESVFMIILKGRLPPENPRLLAANISKHCKTKTDPIQPFGYDV